MADLKGRTLAEEYENLLTKGVGGKIYDGDNVEYADPYDKAEVDALLADKADLSANTWTPTDQSGAGLTFTSIDCKFRKLGQDVMMLMIDFTFPATGDTSNASIGGLPENMLTSAIMDSSSADTIRFSAQAGADSPTFRIRDKDQNVLRNVDLSEKVIRGWIIYLTAPPV